MHEVTTQQPMPRMQGDRMNRKEAAEYLGVSKTFLAQDAMTGRHGVPFYKAGTRMVWYVRSELDAWMAAHKVSGKEAA
ncbi:helix-turn-helix transcriptional regulator [Zoogloea sp.]|uniref:helix-turn-helix transcriptional regulator n=1 Tax=Zoogloea sp. TaxID=49181 RepID=UPI0035B2A3DD